MSVNAIGCVPKRVVGPTASARTWSEYLGAPTHAPSADARFDTNLTMAWRTSLGHPLMGPPAVDDSAVAVQLTDGTAAVLLRETGEVAWKRRLTGQGTGGPLLEGRRVFVATTGNRGKVMALRLRDGHTEWQRGIHDVVGPMALVRGAVVVATSDGGVVALRTTDGDRLWSHRVGGVLRAGVGTAHGHVIVANDDSIFALDAGDGHPLASAAAPGAQLLPPAAIGDTLLLASPDGVLAGLSAQTLLPLWTVQTGNAVVGGAAVARDTAYAVTRLGTLWCVPLATPSAADSTSIDGVASGGASPVTNGVLVGLTTGSLVVAHCGGPASAVFHVDGPIAQPPILDRGELIVGDGRGGVALWR